MLFLCGSLQGHLPIQWPLEMRYCSPTPIRLGRHSASFRGNEAPFLYFSALARPGSLTSCPAIAPSKHFRRQVGAWGLEFSLGPWDPRPRRTLPSCPGTPRLPEDPQPRDSNRAFLFPSPPGSRQPPAPVPPPSTISLIRRARPPRVGWSRSPGLCPDWLGTVTSWLPGQRITRPALPHWSPPWLGWGGVPGGEQPCRAPPWTLLSSLPPSLALFADDGHLEVQPLGDLGPQQTPQAPLRRPLARAPRDPVFPALQGAAAGVGRPLRAHPQGGRGPGSAPSGSGHPDALHAGSAFA